MTAPERKAMPVPTITADLLRALDACEEEIDLFASEWPQGCEVTDENALRAVELGIDVDWLARCALRQDHLRAYKKAIEPHVLAYQEIREPYRRAYQEAMEESSRAYETAIERHNRAYREAIADGSRVYKKAIAPHQRSCDRAIESHRRAYEMAIEPHIRAYKTAVALAFVRAYCAQEAKP